MYSDARLTGLSAMQAMPEMPIPILRGWEVPDVSPQAALTVRLSSITCIGCIIMELDVSIVYAVSINKLRCWYKN